MELDEMREIIAETTDLRDSADNAIDHLEAVVGIMGKGELTDEERAEVYHGLDATRNALYGPQSPDAIINRLRELEDAAREMPTPEDA